MHATRGPDSWLLHLTAWKDPKALVSVGQIAPVESFVLPLSDGGPGGLIDTFRASVSSASDYRILFLYITVCANAYYRVGVWKPVLVLMPLILLGIKGSYWAAKENP